MKQEGLKETPQSHEIKNGILEDISQNYIDCEDYYGNILGQFEYWYERFDSCCVMYEFNYHYNDEIRPSVGIIHYGAYNDLKYLAKRVRKWIYDTFTNSDFYIPPTYNTDLSKCKSGNIETIKQYFHIHTYHDSGFAIGFTNGKTDETYKVYKTLIVDSIDFNQASTESEGRVSTISFEDSLKIHFN